jgi:hypothetical protein
MEVIHDEDRGRQLNINSTLNVENNTEHTAVFTIQQIYIIRQQQWIWRSWDRASWFL